MLATTETAILARLAANLAAGSASVWEPLR